MNSSASVSNLPGQDHGLGKALLPPACDGCGKGGPIVSLGFMDQEADGYEIVLQQLRSAIEKIGHIPEAVLVKRQDLAYVMEHYAPAYGFEVYLVESLPAMEEALDGLQDTMSLR